MSSGSRHRMIPTPPLRNEVHNSTRLRPRRGAQHLAGLGIVGRGQTRHGATGIAARNSEAPQWVLNPCQRTSSGSPRNATPFPRTYKDYKGVQGFLSRWRNAIGQLKFRAGGDDRRRRGRRSCRAPLGEKRHHRAPDLRQDRPGLHIQRGGRASASRSSTTAARRSKLLSRRPRRGRFKPSEAATI